MSRFEVVKKSLLEDAAEADIHQLVGEPLALPCVARCRELKHELGIACIELLHPLLQVVQGLLSDRSICHDFAYLHFFCTPTKIAACV